MSQLIEEMLGAAAGLLFDSSRVPDIIKYILMSVIFGFIVLICVLLAISSPYIAGRLICAAMALLFIAGYVFVIKKIKGK